jgi:hypothetical protein
VGVKIEVSRATPWVTPVAVTVAPEPVTVAIEVADEENVQDPGTSLTPSLALPTAEDVALAPATEISETAITGVFLVSY